mgnify:FL=1
MLFRSEVADRYRRAFEAEQWPGAPGKVVTASFGVSDILLLPGTQGVEDLVVAADGALYKAKLNGRNRVESATNAPANG